MNKNSPYQHHLDQNPANYCALTPLQFLDRSAQVFPDRLSIIHGQQRYSWRETAQRCRRFASALTRLGIGHGDTVAVIAPNIPALYEAHFAVPLAGAVLNAINTRLDAATIAYILEHGEAKVVLADTEFAPVLEKALESLAKKITVIDIVDSEFVGSQDQRRSGDVDYETFVASGDSGFVGVPVEDEWNAISLNYTSGTTGKPKGVVYHHRGAYLNSLSNAIGWNMASHPVYLWTLPMFHCNGWCFPWTLAAVGGTSVCLRNIDAPQIYNAIASHGVTHFCGAPIILNMIVNANEADVRAFDHTVEVMTAAAPPPPSVLAQMENCGFHMTHVYGLTETYGPAVICAWNSEWNKLAPVEQAKLKSRQGVRYHALEALTVMDPETMQSVPADGETMGEVMFRGNVVMKGYFKNAEATAEAFSGGWFHSGDLGVLHTDGYIELRDRSKDIIISGGENISSIEVENVLYQHPSVLEAAVVAKSDEKWGESPCAFIDLKAGADAIGEADIIAHCRDNMAHFKAPKTVIFGPLPKTSTGKVQKFLLRDKANRLDG